MMQLRPVLVTGLGPVSAVGCGKEKFWERLLAGRPGFGPITLFDPKDSPSKVAAEVEDFRLERFLPRGKALARLNPRPAQFALASVALALKDAGLMEYDHQRTGVVVGTSLGNFDLTLNTWTTLRETGVVLPIASYQVFHHNIACVLTSVFHLRGSSHTLSMGCNSGLDAVGFALRQIQVGAADVMVAVGTDCEVLPGVVAALNASGSLSTHYNDRPEAASRPFDRDRDGNVIGEGACCLVLESQEHADKRRAQAYARMAGYAVRSAGRRRYSHDNPEADVTPSVAAMEEVCHQGGLTNGPDLISANGSSSVRYDLVESQALAHMLGPRFSTTPVHSIKSMLGQHGAGSSALQCAAACLTLRHQRVPGTVNVDHLDPGCGELRLIRETRDLELTNVLVHAIGLGGFYYSAGLLSAV